MAKGQIKQKQELIKQDQFELLCMAQCTIDEISAFFGVSNKTTMAWVKNHYKDEEGNEMTLGQVKDVFSTKGKASQKLAFFGKTNKSDKLMNTWLAYYCGITDKVEVEVKADTKLDEYLNSMEAEAQEDDN